MFNIRCLCKFSELVFGELGICKKTIDHGLQCNYTVNTKNLIFKWGRKLMKIVKKKRYL